MIGDLCRGRSPGSDSGNSTDGFQLFITAASHKFSNLSERHCRELFQSPALPAPPKQFWYTCSGKDALKAGCLAAEWFDIGLGGRGLRWEKNVISKGIMR